MCEKGVEENEKLYIWRHFLRVLASVVALTFYSDLFLVRLERQTHTSQMVD